MIYHDIPKEFKYITELDILKGIDKKSLGYYFLIIMTGTLVEHNQWGTSLVNIYELARKKGYLERGYSNLSCGDISYRGMSYDIRASLIKAGISSTPAAFIKKEMALAILNKKIENT